MSIVWSVQHSRYSLGIELAIARDMLKNTGELSGHLGRVFDSLADCVVVYSHLPAFRKYESESLMATIFSFFDAQISQGRTLVFPQYALGSTIDRRRTSSGVLSQEVLNRRLNLGASSAYRASIRSNSILHSHVAVGPRAYDALGNSLGSFHENSDFQSQIETECSILMLGCDFAKGGSLFHHLECVAGVPYRKWRVLVKHVVAEDGSSAEVKFPYFARVDESLREAFRYLGGKLISAGLAARYREESFTTHAMDATAVAGFTAELLEKDPFLLVERSLVS